MNDSIKNAQKKGFAETLYGRRRFLKNINSNNRVVRQFEERVAINMPIQGTAADIIKLAMVKVSQILKERDLQTKLILQVHDELIFDVPKAEADEVVLLVHECMEQVAHLSVPLDADVKVGHSWYETK